MKTLRRRSSSIHNNCLSERCPSYLLGSLDKALISNRRHTQQIPPSSKICLLLIRLRTPSVTYAWRSYKRESKMLSYPADMPSTKPASKNGSKIIINAHAVDTSCQRRRMLSSSNRKLTARPSCFRSSFSEFSSTDFST